MQVFYHQDLKTSKWYSNYYEAYVNMQFGFKENKFVPETKIWSDIHIRKFIEKTTNQKNHKKVFKKTWIIRIMVGIRFIFEIK